MSVDNLPKPYDFDDSSQKPLTTTFEFKGSSPLIYQDDTEGFPSTDSSNLKHRIKQAAPALLGAATIGLLALSILNDFGTVSNWFINFGLGLTFEGTLLTLPLRYSDSELTVYGKVINFKKDKLIKYCAVFFLSLMNLYLNLHQADWLTRTVYGILNFIYGMLIATQIDTIAHWSLKDSRIPDTLDTIPLQSGTESIDAPLPEKPYRETIRMFPPSKEGFHAERNEKQWRIGTEVFTLAVASVAMIAFLVARSVLSDSIGMDIDSYGLDLNSTGLGSVIHQLFVFPLKCSYIYIGEALGALFHEAIHANYRHKQQIHKPQTDSSEYGSLTYITPEPIKNMIRLMKTERVLGILLPGSIIAFNTVFTDLLAGFLLGMMLQIDLIEFTQTHIHQLSRLQKNSEIDPARINLCPSWLSNGLAWIYALAAMGVWMWWNLTTIGFVPYNAGPVFTFPTVVLASYAFAKFMDAQKIDQNSSPLCNWLFFKTLYSPATPIIYIAANQAIPLNDRTLTTISEHDGLVPAITTIAVIGMASLAYAFGTQAAYRGTKRNVSYPAEIDTLTILFSYFSAQQLLGQI